MFHIYNEALNIEKDSKSKFQLEVKI